MTIAPTRPARIPTLAERRWQVMAATSAAGPAALDRAAAHLTQRLTRRAQRFEHGVTDTETAMVMLAVESADYGLSRGTVTWRCTPPLPAPLSVPRLTAAVGELVRTGLLRDYRAPRTGERVLIPAPVHLAVDGLSACLFAGEDLGPMRARLTADAALVDCPGCWAVQDRTP